MNHQKILEALKSREWKDVRYLGQTKMYCPTCSRIQELGHAPDCHYAAAIKQAERLIDTIPHI